MFKTFKSERAERSEARGDIKGFDIKKYLMYSADYHTMGGLYNFEILERSYKRVLDRFFNVVVRALTAMHVTPVMVSHGRLLLGVLGLILMAVGRARCGAGVLLVSLLLDSVDGGLARYQRSLSHRGTFIDRVCDYTLYSASIMTMLLLGEVGGIGAAYHMFIVFTAVIVAVISRNEGKKSDWIINPKANLVWFMILWYASLFWWAFFDGHALEKTLFWLNVLLTISAVESYVAIHRRWFWSPVKKR